MIVLKAGDKIQARLSAVPSGGIFTVTLNAGGTGYTPGTVALTVVQAGAASGVISATASAGGIITSLNSITTCGTGYSVATELATTAGAGSGCKINITSIYQPSYTCSYIDTDDIPGQTTGFFNGTTSVTIAPPPASGQRMVKLGIIFNSDKDVITPIVELVSNSTVEIVPRNVLAVNKTLYFGEQDLSELSLDDDPVNGEINEGITSNWAYDHDASKSGVHGAYSGETNYDLVNTGDFGTNVGTFLSTPSSANLAAAVTDETGTGALVFSNTPTLVTPVIGVATATSVNKVAITAPATSSTLVIADGQTLTCETTSLVNQDLTSDASPTFGGITKIGGASDYASVSSTGLVTMVGGGKGKLTLRPNLVQKQTKVSTNTPTEVYRGLNVGYSFPIWSSDNEELYFRMRIPNRWDGTTDPQLGVMCTITGAEDVGDKFRFQLEWQTTVCGGTTAMGTSTTAVTSEQTIITGGAAANTAYCIFFTLDADDGANPIVSGEMLQGRLRRIAASASEVAGEICVWDFAVTWCVNKMFPVWSTESNVT
jgi:hypothetical protein